MIILEKNNGYIFEIDNVSFAYDTKKVLNDITFKIKNEKITTILGSNGCGKSTLFQLLTKNLKPKYGELKLHQQNITHYTLKSFSKEVAIVHQYNQAPLDISVEKLVSYGRIPYHQFYKGDSQEDEEAITWAMKLTNIEKHRKTLFAHLSGGQKQRVWIAMALAQKTKILLLDEPTTFLDIRYQLEILELIKKLNREYQLSIIMVLHDINQAMHYSDEIIALSHGGELLIQGSPMEVIDQEMLKRIYNCDLQVEIVKDKPVILMVS